MRKVYRVTSTIVVLAEDENEAALRVESALDRLYPQGVLGEPVVTATETSDYS